MIALRGLLVVALAYTATGETDYDLALKLSECLRRTLINGLPSVHIPIHDPLRINHNISWHGDVGVASGTFNLSNIVWYGIPNWDLRIHQYPSIEESQVAFYFNLWWSKFVFTSEYTLETNVVLIPGEIQGDLNFTLVDTQWDGVLNFTKPGYNKTEQLDYLDFRWDVERVKFNFTGLGLFNEPIANSLSGHLKNFFDSGVINSYLSEGLLKRLNTYWFAHNDRIDKILDYCKTNETVSQ